MDETDLARYVAIGFVFCCPGLIAVLLFASLLKGIISPKDSTPSSDPWEDPDARAQRRHDEEVAGEEFRRWKEDRDERNRSD
jgi:hypothetical protein